MPGRRSFKIYLRAVQLGLFVLMTFVISYMACYFPNTPPLLRHFTVKNRIDLGDRTAKKPDERFLAWFHRDPERLIPQEPNVIVSPADGFVAAVGPRDGKQHILIEMRYTDVHVQRVPLDGLVVAVEGEGKPLPKGMTIGDYTLEKLAPYQKWTILRTEIGDVVVRQITSLFANRVEVFVKEGDPVTRGQRLGRVLAGSNVVIELPKNVHVLVQTGQDVVGGETIIARY